ncbi:hypothetical protein CONPUDRAFT_53597, partial [Coniophora puteana RWD-64-598 SS2]
LRASLLLFITSEHCMVLQRMQLECSKSMASRQNLIVNAFTSSGKTIAMLLPILLKPEKVLLIISPMKQLQLNQVSRMG